MGFKDEMANYEKINPEVVNTLFAFLDFDNFKKEILTFKNKTNENFAPKEDIDETGKV